MSSLDGFFKDKKRFTTTRKDGISIHKYSYQDVIKESKDGKPQYLPDTWEFNIAIIWGCHDDDDDELKNRRFICTDESRWTLELNGSFWSRTNHMKYIESIIPQYHCMECNKEMTKQESLDQIFTSIFDADPDKYDQWSYGCCSSCSDEVCDKMFVKFQEGLKNIEVKKVDERNKHFLSCQDLI